MSRYRTIWGKLYELMLLEVYTHLRGIKGENKGGNSGGFCKMQEHQKFAADMVCEYDVCDQHNEKEFSS